MVTVDEEMSPAQPSQTIFVLDKRKIQIKESQDIHEMNRIHWMIS